MKNVISTCIFLLFHTVALPAISICSDPDSTSGQHGAETKPPVQLQEVTVFAPGDQREPQSSVTVLSDIISRPATTDSWDLLRQAAGLEVHEQGQGPGFASDASIRGFSSDHSTDIALWVDGVPVNEPVNGHAEGYNDFSLLFPQLIRNIEILKGPISPLYGNFALAGTVNVRTVERVDSTVAWFSGGSAGRLEGTLVTGFDHSDWGGVLGIRGQRDDGWRPNSAWRLGQLYGRFSHDLSDAVTLDGGIGLYASGWDSPGFLTVDQFDRRLYDTVANPSDGGYKRRAQERLSLRVFASPALLWRSTLYATQGQWQFFLTIPPEPGSGEGSGSQTEEDDHRYGYGATSALSWSVPWGDITIGTEGRFDHADYQNWFSHDRKRDSARVLVSARQFSGAMFLQTETRIFNNLRLSLGGRYDVLGTQSDPAAALSSTAAKGIFSPKSGISFHVLPWANVYTNISRGFRQTDGVITQPSLPFITAWNYEAGVKLRNDFSAIDLAVFRMDVDNEQSFNPVTLNTTSNGASRRQGIDMTVHLRLTGSVEVTSTWTLTDGKYRQLIAEDGTSLSGSQIFNTAKYVGTVAFEISPPTEFWRIGLGSNFVGPYAPFDEPGVLLPPYILFNLSGSVHVGNILLEIGSHNIFDKAYPEIRAGGFVDPGQPRSIYSTLRCSF